MSFFPKFGSNQVQRGSADAKFLRTSNRTWGSVHTNVEPWTELGSGSEKFRFELWFRTELRHPYRGELRWHGQLESSRNFELCRVLNLSQIQVTLLKRNVQRFQCHGDRLWYSDTPSDTVKISIERARILFCWYYPKQTTLYNVWNVCTTMMTWSSEPL